MSQSKQEFLQYKTYNPSWTKLFCTGVASVVFGDFIAPNKLKPSPIPLALYHAHNIYSYFQHKKEVEKQTYAKLKYEDETRVVKYSAENGSYIRPVFDSFGLIGSLCLSIEEQQQEGHHFLLKSLDPMLQVYVFCGVGYLKSKVLHLISPSEEKYTFTDINTGEEIHYFQMETAELILS
jgi:hypothetical protein